MPMEARLLDTWHGEDQAEVDSLFLLVLLFSPSPLFFHRHSKHTPLSGQKENRSRCKI